MKKLFVYSKADAMIGHRFNDDVALCYAASLDEAIQIFSNMYDAESIIGYVWEAQFNDNGICVCTDY